MIWVYCGLWCCWIEWCDVFFYLNDIVFVYFCGEVVVWLYNYYMLQYVFIYVVFCMRIVFMFYCFCIVVMIVLVVGIILVLVVCNIGVVKCVLLLVVSLQQLIVCVDGGWDVVLWLQNFSLMFMIFDVVVLFLKVDDEDVGILQIMFVLLIGGEFVDVVILCL